MSKKVYIEKKQTEKQVDLTPLAKKWTSTIVARQELKEFSGGALNARTMANYDSQGTGINGRFTIGKKVVYPVDEAIAWMEARASLPEKGKVGQGGNRA
ncbi:MAG: hypothetical protein D3910_09510 [Candidatus Electrothrix sp. ATG2]|nr:hypothetical protein [Candidatus Electrothrix sp. ATG2]